MFMFVFAIILISLVGLFLQITNALTMYLASQQLGMGGQLITWHNLAKEYACTSGMNPGVPVTGTHTTTTDPTLANSIRATRTEYQGRNWGTAIFSGSIGGNPTSLVLSYIPNNTVFAGITSTEAVRQFRNSFKNNEYRFSVVYTGASPTDGSACTDRCIDIIVSANGRDSLPVVVSGVPSDVPAGVNGMVSSVSCN